MYNIIGEITKNKFVPDWVKPDVLMNDVDKANLKKRGVNAAARKGGTLLSLAQMPLELERDAKQYQDYQTKVANDALSSGGDIVDRPSMLGSTNVKKRRTLLGGGDNINTLG